MGKVAGHAHGVDHAYGVADHAAAVDELRERVARRDGGALVDDDPCRRVRAVTDRARKRDRPTVGLNDQHGALEGTS